MKNNEMSRARSTYREVINSNQEITTWEAKTYILEDNIKIEHKENVYGEVE
jgi:hypothetical protein